MEAAGLVIFAVVLIVVANIKLKKVGVADGIRKIETNDSQRIYSGLSQ